jgi:hypothetical protein
MEGERLGRVVAVALLALLTPVACAAIGAGTPSVSGLPPSDDSASPAVQPYGGEEAPTTRSIEEAFQKTVRQAGYWAVPAGQQPRRDACDKRVHASVLPVHQVVEGSTTQSARGPATSAPEATPIAMRYLRAR